jgi:uncharacterized protein (DUF1684 family)
MRKEIPVVAVAVLSSLLAACDRSDPGSMVSILPPAHWAAGLEADRAAKDEAFRTSPDTPLRPGDVERFGGLDYWAPDPGYYFAGPIRLYAQREPFWIVTTSGEQRPCEKFGWIEFPIDGSSHRLQVYRLLDLGHEMDAGSLLLPFTDATSGGETYPAGRYVDLEGPPGEIEITQAADGLPVAPGPYVLDFNRAYNPSCAYGAPERFACPVAPKDNRLGVRVEAGERGYYRPDAARDG